MARPRRIGGTSHEESESSVHGDRPWVYFMVDCFFLVTEFYILTFQLKVNEYVLPAALPPGSYPPMRDFRDTRESLAIKAYGTVQRTPIKVVTPNGVEDDEIVHVTPSYEFMGRRLTLPELSARLAADHDKTLKIQVSYDKDTPWEAVGLVFNECQRFKITGCGLQTLH